jgi:hypothetical protein
MLSDHLKSLLQREYSRKDFLKVTAIGFVSIFGVTGVITEILSHAASPSASGEAEDGTLAGGATVVEDSNASGGSAVRFGNSYSATVLSLPDLAAYWPLNEPAGAGTAVDLGPNNLPLTYHGSGGKSSGSNICAGLGASYATDGLTEYAQETGTPTDTALALTGEFSIGGWFQFPSSLPASGSLLTRGSSNYYLNIAANMYPYAGADVIGSTIVGDVKASPYSYGAITTGTPYFLVCSWDGTEMTLWINGLKEQCVRLYGGSIVDSSSSLQLLYNNSTYIKALASGIFVVGRGITAGECMELFAQGTTLALPTEAFSLDFAQSTVPATASQPIGRRCDACGGQRYANEATTTIGSYKYHPGCYTAYQYGKPETADVAGTTPLQSSGEIAKLMWNYITWATRRTTSSDLLYLSPTTDLPVTFVSPGVPNTESSFGSYAGLATSAAMLVRYGNVPSSSWLLSAIKAIHNGAISQQTPAGDYDTMAAGTPGQFYPIELGQTILLLGDTLDATTKAAWVKSLLLYMNSYYLGYYYPYYANGNIEIQNLLLVWLTGQITGDAKWTTQYANQYQVAVDPVAVQAATTGHNVNAPGNGLVYTKVPTLADGSDGAGYLVESGASSCITSITTTNPAIVTLAAPLQGICPTMSAATNTVYIKAVSTALNGSYKPTILSSTSFSIPVDNSSGTAFTGSGTSGANAQAQGFDGDYAQFQMSVATRLWMYTKDPNILRIMNVLYNQTSPLCSSTYVYNATNGTRHTTTLAYFNCTMQTLNFVYGRSLPAANVSTQWNTLYQTYFGGFNGTSQGYWRGLSYDVGGTLMCSSDWPGLPS